MSTRNKYALFYVGSMVISLIVGLLFRFGLGLLLAYAAGFALSFWYGGTLGLSAGLKILVSVFNVVGFFFLLGYDPKLPGTIKLIHMSLQLYENNFKRFIGYIATLFGANILLIILLLLTTFATNAAAVGSFLLKLSTGTESNATLSASNGLTGQGIITFLLVGLIFLIAFIIVNIWTFAALARAIRDAYAEMPTVSFKENIRLAWKKIWKLFWAYMLKIVYMIWPLFISLNVFAVTALASAKGASFASGPTIGFIIRILGIYSIFHLFYYSVRLIFTEYAVIFDDKKIRESLRYSKALTKNKWWAILWRVSASGFIVSLVASAVLWVTQLALMSLGGGRIGPALASAAYIIIQMLILPVSIIILIILYFECKKLASGTGSLSSQSST